MNFSLAAATPRVHADPLRGLRVLLVEDDPAARETTAAMLADAGCVVLEAETAREALARFEAEGADLVVADLRLPGGEDGLDLARRLAATDAGLPILLCTGADPEAARPFLTLPKPFDRARLIDTLRCML